jgi:hypothetical protein
MKETTIPFSGFYYSYHSDELDRVSYKTFYNSITA